MMIKTFIYTQVSYDQLYVKGSVLKDQMGLDTYSTG